MDINYPMFHIESLKDALNGGDKNSQKNILKNFNSIHYCIFDPPLSSYCTPSFVSTVLALTSTLEDIIAEIDALLARLDNIESNLAHGELTKQ